MPHAGLCVSTWQQFQCPHYTRKTQAIMRYNWHLNPSHKGSTSYACPMSTKSNASGVFVLLVSLEVILNTLPSKTATIIISTLRFTINHLILQENRLTTDQSFCTLDHQLFLQPMLMPHNDHSLHQLQKPVTSVSVHTSQRT
jgi:hypothetical protein